LSPGWGFTPGEWPIARATQPAPRQRSATHGRLEGYPRERWVSSRAILAGAMTALLRASYPYGERAGRKWGGEAGSLWCEGGTLRCNGCVIGVAKGPWWGRGGRGRRASARSSPNTRRRMRRRGPYLVRHPPVSARCPGAGPRRRLLPLPSPRTRYVGGEARRCGGSVFPACLAAARGPHPLPGPRPARSYAFVRGLSVCISLSLAPHPSTLKRLRVCQSVATVP
jgi:hypothetical protein